MTIICDFQKQATLPVRVTRRPKNMHFLQQLFLGKKKKKIETKLFAIFVGAPTPRTAKPLHPNHRTPAKALAPTLKSGRDGRQVARAAIRKTPRAPIPSDTIRTNGFRSDEHVLHARSWAPGRGAGDLYASFCPARNFILRFTFLCLQICSHFEKVSSAAVDTLAEILSR